MRTRRTKFWENKISSEMKKPIDKQFIGRSCQPVNSIEEVDYQIAEFMVTHQAKSNKPIKLVA